MSHLVDIDASTERNADHKIEELFVQRWSPRAFRAADMQEETLNQLLEAARWAPSSFNIQPWRFIYALRGDKSFKQILDALVPVNRSWAEDAGALVVISSLTINPDSGDPAPTHEFDAGAAWMNFSLQGAAMGLAVHAMAGFDHDKIANAVHLPEKYALHAVVAVGTPGDIDELPDKLAEREEPSGRKPLTAFCFRHRFPDHV